MEKLYCQQHQIAEISQWHLLQVIVKQQNVNVSVKRHLGDQMLLKDKEIKVSKTKVVSLSSKVKHLAQRHQ